MENQFLDDMRKRLVANHKEALERVERTLRWPGARNGGGLSLPDEMDQAAATTVTEMTFHVADVRARRARQIAYAVGRLANGSYGVCEWCGKRIPLKRLRLVPHATSCVGCQADVERETAAANEQHKQEEADDGQV